MDAMTPIIIRRVREALPQVQAIYRYGSTASGTAGLESDVDVGLLLAPGGDAAGVDLKLFRLGGALGAELGRPVDLVDLRRASTVLCKEVLAMGSRIDAGDERAADEFEMLTLSYYQRLNRERCEILESFWETGRAVAP